MDELDLMRGPQTPKGEQARGEVVAALRKCCDLADAVEEFQGTELIEVLDFIDSLRIIIGESSGTLRGVVKSFNIYDE